MRSSCGDYRSDSAAIGSADGPARSAPRQRMRGNWRCSENRARIGCGSAGEAGKNPAVQADPFSPDPFPPPALAPGEQAGRDTNVASYNVNLLKDTNLDPAATITLHACYAGFGSGRYSIAQLIANQLHRRVYAPTAGTFFSVDPNSHLSGGSAPNPPDQKPIYQLQDFGVLPSTFLPAIR